MKVFILTCPSLASQRLIPMMRQLLPLIDDGLIDDIEIISGTDEALAEELGIDYDRTRWQLDIEKAWDIFHGNILSSQNISKKVSLNLTATQAIPERALTQSEHSIAMRHIKAIKEIEKQPNTCLDLEDDVIIKNYENVSTLINNVLNGYEKVTYFDLYDDYIPLFDETRSGKKSISGLEFLVQPIAVTRTLMAYAINKPTAERIRESLQKYSLPIDMHLQVVLKEKTYTRHDYCQPIV